MDLKKIVSIIGIVVCVATVITGVSLMGEDLGMNHPSYMSFGGDFYTYSYNVTRSAAENVAYLGAFLQKALCTLMVMIGLIGACYFGVKFTETLSVSDRRGPSENASAPSEEQRTEN